MKIIWISDIHLNFLGLIERKEFYRNLIGDLIIISGDIAESNSVVQLIKEIETETGLPVFFVLGNHDFYRSRVSSVKRLVKPLGYLGSKQIVPLGSSTALVGVDGWGDCRYGSYEDTRMIMSDWYHIDELRKAYATGRPKDLKEALQKLSDKDARSLKRKVKATIKEKYKKVIIVTHVPPFEEACLYNGRKSTPSGLPFFASKILGETILPIVRDNPDIDFLWLSGHTHSRSLFKPCENLTVKVAASEYGSPNIEEIFEFGDDND